MFPTPLADSRKFPTLYESGRWLRFNFDGQRYRARFHPRRMVWDPHENRNITAHGNVDTIEFLATFAGKVLGQALAQLTGIVPHNVVLNRAIALRPVKHLHADLMLRNFVFAALQG